jgi:hypothetical protein
MHLSQVYDFRINTSGTGTAQAFLQAGAPRLPKIFEGGPSPWTSQGARYPAQAHFMRDTQERYPASARLLTVRKTF